MLKGHLETAETLNIKPATLKKWRVYGQGPAFLKIGHKVAYDQADVDAWLDARRRASTSQAA